MRVLRRGNLNKQSAGMGNKICRRKKVIIKEILQKVKTFIKAFKRLINKILKQKII